MIIQMKNDSNFEKGSSGYSANDDVDYLKWISENAKRPKESSTTKKTSGIYPTKQIIL